MMHSTHGMGFRLSRDGDPEWLVVPDYGTLVWTMARPEPKPKT